MHPLDGAYERVKRASEHLNDFKDRIDFVCKYEPQFVTFERRAVAWQVFNSKKWSHLKAVNFYSRRDPILSVLAGEVIYNLRAALEI